MAQSVPLHRLAQLVGHDSLDTTMIYVQVMRSDLQEEVESITSEDTPPSVSDAQSKFSVVAHWPEQGQTGGFSNAHLRSIAFLGLAAVHMELQDSSDVIAEDIGAAVYADSATAEQWLGKDIVRRLLQATSAPLSVSSVPKVTIPRAASQLIFYDREAGQGEIYGVEHQGHMSLFRQYRWRTSWTEILPLWLGDKHILLFYDRNAGEGEFYSTNRNGGISLLKHHTWRTSWMQIVAGHFSQNYATGLLFYDRNAGEGEFYSVDGNGEIHLLKRHRWRTSWTQILPGHFGKRTNTDLLFYDRNAGEGEFYSVDGNGEIHLLRRHRQVLGTVSV
jgi:hypothetical protein